MANPSMDRDAVGLAASAAAGGPPGPASTDVGEHGPGADGSRGPRALWRRVWRALERADQLATVTGGEWDTRTGSIELSIPKLRQGSYFRDSLLEPRRRAERALVTVIAQAYLAGVSSWRVERLVQTLGIHQLSKSQVSVMAKSLDGVSMFVFFSPSSTPLYGAMWWTRH
jgi:Transposase, Mutator family